MFWQPIVSPHQRDFLEALALAFPGEVILAAERPLPAERRAQGWPTPRHERVRVLDAGDPAVFGALCSLGDAGSLHVFTGFFTHRTVWRGFRRLRPTAARLALVSEAPEQTALAGWLKRLRARIAVSRFGTRLEFALAMGAIARRFFVAAGLPPRKVVDFGYYLDVPDRPWPDAGPRPPGPVRFLAAGQMIRRKGFDLLLRALARLPREGWRCDVFGDGPERGRLEATAGSAALGGRVSIGRTLPHDELRLEIARSDWSIVPSRHDGWGMLVNESLVAGTPVICSDGCGAADWIDDAAAGCVFPAGNVGALAAALERCLRAGMIDGERRRAVHALARNHGVDAAVDRFLALVASGGPP